MVEKAMGKCRKTVRNYLANSSINGYKYLTGQRNKNERCIWAIFNIALLLITLYLVRHTWRRFSEAPTAIWKISSRHVVDYHNFPKIAICEINKIGRKSAVKLAKTLTDRSITDSNMTFDDIMSNLPLLGRLYDYNFNSGDEIKLVAFQTNLESLIGPDEDLIKTLLIELSKPCHEFLTDCHWNGLEVDCQLLFSDGMTSEGLCCVLNDHRPTVTTTDLRGPTGIAVTVKTDVDDYFYASLAMVGAKVMIYDRNSFPDSNSGGVTEKLLSAGSKLRLLLDTQMLVTTHEVKTYPVATRNCLYRDERVTTFGRYYDKQNCVTECKLKSIAALCQCIPFQYQNSTNLKERNYPSCNLADITCLSRYKSKWNTLFPLYTGKYLLAREKQDSLICVDCLAPCADIFYTIWQDYYRMRNNNSEFVDSFSRLEVFFRNPFGGIFIRDVLFYWYDMIGIFGGLCSLVMGASFISVIEFFYYFCLKSHFG